MSRKRKPKAPKQLRKPAEFLAFCSIVRSVRQEQVFRKGEPLVLALLVPSPQDFDLYHEVIQRAFHGWQPNRRTKTDDAWIEVFQATRRKFNRSYNLLEAAAGHEKLILLADSRESLPDGVDGIADAVVQIQKPDTRHVRAAAKLFFGQTLTDEQAVRIAGSPLRIAAAAWRKGRNITKTIEAMTRIASPKRSPASGPTLDDLCGMGEASDWGKELARDLDDWRAGTIPWGDVDRGALVSGPPGCGKTTYAQAVARTCNVHLVAGSLAQWQARGHLGDLLKAMRSAFAEAAENAPSVLFIDEIDSVGDRLRFSGDSAQYYTEVVNGLLECLDGVGGREGVVVIAATNYPEKLDAALVRPGRLDRHIRIPLPDREARDGILRWHLRDNLVGADLSEVVDRTEGWTGARLEQLSRDARRCARRARRPMTVADLVAGLPKRIALPEKLLWRYAVHESGHAVVRHVLEIGQLEHVSIAKSLELGGDALQFGGGMCFSESAFPEMTKSNLLNRIAMQLGGLAAEEVILESRSAGGGGREGADLHLATVDALLMEASFGLGEHLTYLVGMTEGDMLSLLRKDTDFRQRVDKLLSREFERAKGIVADHRPELEKIAEELLRKQKLSREEVEEIFARQPPPRRVTGIEKKIA
ncbi:AAA family ATPase [Chelativorans sp. AA-79]|uniref:AAA family ATPase n=1 Tax=Chelativorans sp. AA-79 TaxID=3028735 RepID=UPI0023F7CB81|nr:AAA family ATPase [Chelativorans sp. AA-79]WEX11683.1 AAA family ATPase [Chelativorans sp. AA-79]